MATQKELELEIKFLRKRLADKCEECFELSSVIDRWQELYTKRTRKK